MFETLKNIGIAIGTLTAAWSLAWSIGIAPITNATAENMINDAVKQESTDIKNQIKSLEDKIQEWDTETGAVKGKIERIDERTLTTRQLQTRILDELQNLRQSIGNNN